MHMRSSLTMLIDDAIFVIIVAMDVEKIVFEDVEPIVMMNLCVVLSVPHRPILEKLQKALFGGEIFCVILQMGSRGWRQIQQQEEETEKG